MSKKESKVIADIIKLLEHGQFRDRKQYLKDIRGKGAKINGFTIQMDTYCWLIWKPTDSIEEPQYKGEPLLKVVPQDIYPINMIEKIVDMLPWSYV